MKWIREIKMIMIIIYGYRFMETILMAIQIFKCSEDLKEEMKLIEPKFYKIILETLAKTIFISFLRNRAGKVTVAAVCPKKGTILDTFRP